MAAISKSAAASQIPGVCDRCARDFSYMREPLVETIVARGESVSLCDECKTKRYCQTCGSEIVWDINESNFDEGECGSCEYERYMRARIGTPSGVKP